MTELSHELRIMQNPALGAVLLWRFAFSYARAHPTGDATGLPLLFLPLPMVWHETTFEYIASTRVASGLRVFAAKFKESSPSQLDILLNLHERAVRWRPKTRESLRIALATGLLRLHRDGRVLALNNAWPMQSQSATVKQMCHAVEKLGTWFAPLSLRETSLALHVHF